MHYIIKCFNKNKINVTLFLIIVVGFLFRLWGLYKPEGMWFDEYYSYYKASLSFPVGIMNHIINNDCHMPIYYFILHFWMKLLGDSDLVIRLLSLVFGVATIPVIYITGKEFDSQKTGFIAATFLAINSFNIYYSQEVRIYSLLALVSTITLLFFIRTIKKPNKKNYAGLIISNLAILYTHTIGFVYVFFELLGLFIYFLKKDKSRIKSIINSTLIIFLFFTPGIYIFYKIYLMTTHNFTQWWTAFNFSKIAFMFSDFFSPILINLVSTSLSFVKLIYNNGVNINNCIFILFPTIIAIISIYKSIRQNKTALLLGSICLSTLIVMVMVALSDKMVFITKYITEIFPPLLLVFAYGVTKFKTKHLSSILLTVFILINTGFLVFNPHSAPKKHRAEGHKIVGDLLNKSHLSNNDMIVTLYYKPYLFNKYYDSGKHKTFYINKKNFYKIVSNKDIDFSEIINNGHDELFDYIADNNPEYFNSQIKTNIIDKLNKGDKVVIINLGSVSFFPYNQIKMITKYKDIYQNTPLLYLIFSKVKIDMLYYCYQHLKLVSSKKQGRWEATVFEKE